MANVIKEKLKVLFSLLTAPNVFAQLILPLVFLLSYNEIRQSMVPFLAFIISSLLLVILPSITVFIYAIIKKISLEFIDRRERPPIFFFFFLHYLIGFMLFYFIKCRVLYALFFTYLILILFLMIINFKWKISVHTAGITAPSVFLFLLYGVVSSLLLALIPIITWSRIKMQRHSTLQAICGIFVAVIATFIAYQISFSLI